jgi:hypothetical protein
LVSSGAFHQRSVRSVRCVIAALVVEKTPVPVPGRFVAGALI